MLQFSTEVALAPDYHREMSHIDPAVLAPNINEGIAQMRDGRMPPSFPVDAKENYQNFEDFVERGQGRAKLIA